MAALGITKALITAGQRIIVEWTAKAPAPASYIVTATCAGKPTLTTTVAGSVTKARLGKAWTDQTYSITVTAGTDTGAPRALSTAIPYSMGETIKQTIFDILYDAALTHDGRSVTMIHDGYWRPRKIRRGEVIASSLPAIDFPSVEYQGAPSAASMVRREETWRIAFRLQTDASTEPDIAVDRLWYLLSQAQAALDATDRLGLGHHGVHDLRWTWDATAATPGRGRDRLAVIDASLTLAVEREIVRS